MNLKQEFSPEVSMSVLPRIPTPLGRGGAEYLRTPLHIDFPDQSEESFAPSSPVPVEDINNPDAFNAVGSRCKKQPAFHFPVIDVDGGAKLQKVGTGKSKVIVCANPDVDSSKKTFAYGPRSLLRDVLGDNGIDLEVFDEPLLRHSSMTGRTYLAGKRVTSIVLRTDDKDKFDVASSTQKGHSHLYIQREFSDADHATLIDELGDLGIISRRWQEIAEKEGMGIVRTPWTENARTYRSS